MPHSLPTLYHTFPLSRLTQLLLPKKHEEPCRHRQIHQQPHPEPRPPQPGHRPRREIREYVPRPNPIGRRRPRQDRSYTPEDLRGDQSKKHMEPRQRLQQNHAEPDALHRVQHAKPQPQAPPRDRARHGAAGPGDVGADVGGAPEHLGPAGGAEAHGEDGEHPGVVRGEAGEDVEQGGPDADEEDEHEEDDAPCGHVLRGPEVEPVAAVGRAEPVVLDDDHDEEPEDDLASEEGGVEGGDVAGGLAVVFRQADEEGGADGPHEDGDGDADGDDGCGAGDGGGGAGRGVLGGFG